MKRMTIKNLVLSIVISVTATTVPLSILAPEKANAQVAEIAAGMVMSVNLQQLISGIKNIIAELENSSTVGAYNLRSELSLLLRNLEEIANSFRDKTFGDLTGQQQLFFNQANQLVQNGTKDIQQSLRQLEEVSASFRQVLSGLPFYDKTPFVNSYMPHYYMIENNKEVLITVRGSLLGNGTPNLKFSNKECTLVSKGETLLTFSCPITIFSDSSKWISGVLNVYTPRPWYKFFGEGNARQYLLGIKPIPMKFGTYSLSVVLNNTDTSVDDRSQHIHYMNDHCAPPARRSWTFSHLPTCNIDTKSIFIERQLSSQSVMGDAEQVTPDGFIVNGIAINSGDCGPFGYPRDGRGILEATVRWKEKCSSSHDITVEDVASGDLLWANDLELSLPRNTRSFSLRVMRVDGVSEINVDTRQQRWYDVEYNRLSRSVLVRPKSIEEALR